MTDIGRAVDMSKWGGDLTAPEAREMKAAGVDLLIIDTNLGTQGRDEARQQMESGLEAGHRLGAYPPPFNYDQPAREQVDYCKFVCEPFNEHIEFIGLDHEDEASAAGKSPEQLIAFARETVEACAGWKWSLFYCGREFFMRYFANTAAFSDIGLWLAFWNGQPDMSMLPIGTWPSPVIKQYEGDTLLAGQSVDLNVYDREALDRIIHPPVGLILPTSPPAPEAPTPVPELTIRPELSQDRRRELEDGIKAWAGQLYAVTFSDDIGRIAQAEAAVRALVTELAA